MVLTGATMSRPSESGHWYDRDGSPRYEVKAKDGSMRPATLRDARKFGWFPGVTSIIRCAAAPTWDQAAAGHAAMLARVSAPSGSTNAE
jgi:hypothetical protein